MADKNVILHPQGDSSTNIYPHTKVENIDDLDLSIYATKEDLEDKQDVISDLETIRTGAGLGATALQSVPNTYRTSADQDVIDAGKQDTLVFETSYDASTNKAATMADIQAAIGDAMEASY